MKYLYGSTYVRPNLICYGAYYHPRVRRLVASYSGKPTSMFLAALVNRRVTITHMH